MAPPDKQENIDTVLETLGPLGRYSLVQFAIVLFAMWPVAMNMFSMVFQAQENAFRCSNSTWKISENITIDSLNASREFPNKCHVTLPDVVNGSSVNTSRSCDIHQLEYLNFKSMSFVSEFDLVCEHQYQIGLSQTLLTLGNLVGAFVFPVFSDHYGRKIVLLVTSILGLAVSLAMACSVNYDMLVTLKFFLGFFNQGTESAAVGAAAETMVTRYRAIFFAFGGALNWAIASAVVAPIAYLLRDHSWRALQFAISCFSVNILLFIFVFDETLRWVSANGLEKRVQRILKKACRWNNVDFKKVSDVYISSKNSVDNIEFLEKKENRPETDEKDEKLIFFHLFTDPMLRKHTFFCILSWFFNSLIYFALTLMSNTLHGSLYINYTLSIVFEVPASLYCLFFLDRVGRRWSFAILSVIAGVALILMGVVWEVAPDQSALLLVLTLVGKFAVTGSYTTIYMYAPELFPTNLRSMGMGLGYVSSRVGGMLAPFGGLLMDHVIYAPGLIFGISSLLLSVTPYFLPETSGRQLPQTLAEMKRWR